MNDTQLLARLGTAYASVAPPTPNAELAARMARGDVGDADHGGTRHAVVVPLVVRRPRTRTRTRTRYSVAAAVAALVVVSGLAVAGALPDPVQRQVSSFASHFGLDLPAPGGSHDGRSTPRNEGTTPATRPTPAIAPATAPVSTEPVVPPAAADPPVSPASPTTPAATITHDQDAVTGTLGQVGAVTGPVVTTIPSTGTDPLPEPGVTVPPPTVPQATLPPTPTLPPITVPPLPPVRLPGL